MFQVIVLLCIFISSLWAQDCINCHQAQISKCQSSNHFTLKNAINITRNAWGIKDSNVTLQTLPLSKTQIKKPADLVDDFLRRKCLKCHLGVENSGEQGMSRKKNCLACHSKHSKIGKCQPEKIAMSKCLSCHNKEFVGTDYQGLFPKDYNHEYRAPLKKDGKYPEVKYGIDYHHLNQDVHFKLGMSCVDCHNNKNGENWESGTTCKECHKKPSKENHIAYHRDISCSACHSSWNMSSYELSVYRDDMADYAKWKDLILQEDGYLNNFLKKAIKSKKKIKPFMPDWLDMKLKKGIWYSGWRYRRWEDFVLGNDEHGKISILRPIFQYRVSYRDENGTMILDDVSSVDGKKLEAWVPYSPHTITKKAKSCERCHENVLQNKDYKKNTIFNLKIPQNIVKGTSLRQNQLDKLHSQKYKRVRAKMFK